MIVNVHLLSGQFFPIGSTYHVIAFFFTAGLVHGFTEKCKNKSIITFAKDRSRKLGHPFLVLSACYILMHMTINFIRGEVILNDVIIVSLLETVTLKGIGTLWFLPVLYLGEIIFFSLKKKNVSDWLVISIGVLAIFISSYLNKKFMFGSQSQGDISVYTVFIRTPITLILSSLIASAIIDLGYLLYFRFSWIFNVDNYKTKENLYYLLIVCISSFAIDFLLVEYYRGDLHKLDIGNPYVYIICSLTGLVFVSTLSLIISCISRPVAKFMRYLGKNSLIIMTTHSEYYINSIAFLSISFLISTLDVSITSKAISGFSVLLIMIIEIGVIRIVNHSFLRYIYSTKQNK